jgi:hypothetical protein
MMQERSRDEYYSSTATVIKVGFLQLANNITSHHISNPRAELETTSVRISASHGEFEIWPAISHDVTDDGCG